MRGVTIGLLVLLAACSGSGAGGLRGGQPGVDVAEAAMRGGSPEIALQVAGGLLAQNPANQRALIVKGDALTTLGHLDEAAATFTVALQNDPASVPAHIGLGRLRLGTDPGSAEALFLEALQRDPRNAIALNDLGIARDLLGHHADAQAAYSQALALDPGMTAAQVNMALSMAMSGRSGEAVQLLRPLASNPSASPKLRHDLAAVLTMAGKKDEASHILSADLTPDEVQQALTAYASAQSAGGPTALLPDSVPVAEPASAPLSAPPTAPPASTTSTKVATTAPIGVKAEALTTSQPSASSVSAAPPAAGPIAAASAAAPIKAEASSGQPTGRASSLPAQSPTPAATEPAPIVATLPPASADTAAVAAKPVAPARTGAAVRVQLASVDSEDGAKNEWQRLRKRMPDILDGREPIIVKGEHDGRTVWRLRAGGFDDVTEASEFCDRVHAVGAVCITIQ